MGYSFSVTDLAQQSICILLKKESYSRLSLLQYFGILLSKSDWEIFWNTKLVIYMVPLPFMMVSQLRNKQISEICITKMHFLWFKEQGRFPQWLHNSALFGGGREGSQSEKWVLILKTLECSFQGVASTWLRAITLTMCLLNSHFILLNEFKTTIIILLVNSSKIIIDLPLNMPLWQT